GGLRRQEPADLARPERPGAAAGNRRHRRSRDRGGAMSTLPTTQPPVEAATAPPQLRSRHLLGIAGLDAGEITLILDTTEAMKEIGGRAMRKVPTLRGRTVVNLFFEPSTRTRT